MSNSIGEYTIQQWLFDEAVGKFTIDLAESGIQYHYIADLNIDPTDHLNYSIDRGEEQLRKIIANLYQVNHKHVIITHGSQEALYLFYRSYLKPEDHVIVFTPGWQQSWEVPKAIGADVTKIKLLAEEGYRLNFSHINAAIKSNTKLIVLTNPCNPTGVKLTAQELLELKEFCEHNALFLLADEEYFFDYPDSIVNKVKNSGVVSSLSKIYGFPGLRLGWFVGPTEIIESMVNYKRYITVSNSSLCESLAKQVLLNHQFYLDRYNQMVDNGYQTLTSWLSTKDKFRLIKAEGTPFVYLVFPDKQDSFKFCRSLLNNQGVLLMPAEVFEDEHAIRISIGRSSELLQEGFEKINQQLQKC